MKKQTHFATNSNIKDRQQFEVLRRTPDKSIMGVKMDGHNVRFGDKSGAALIDDHGLAKEIFHTQGQGGTGDVLVVPVEKPNDPNHQRTFTVSIEFDEDGKIIR